MAEPPYRIRLELDPEDRVWLARWVEDDRAHTYGRTLREAKKHAMEVLSLWLDLPGEELVDAELVEWEVSASASSAADLRRVRELRAAQARVESDYQRAVLEAVRHLVDAGVSQSDVAEAVGLSKQRISQVLSGS